VIGVAATAGVPRAGVGPCRTFALVTLPAAVENDEQVVVPDQSFSRQW